MLFKNIKTLYSKTTQSEILTIFDTIYFFSLSGSFLQNTKDLKSDLDYYPNQIPITHLLRMKGEMYD